MTSAQVVETSVTNNTSSQNYTHPDDHTIRTTESSIISNDNSNSTVTSAFVFPISLSVFGLSHSLSLNIARNEYKGLPVQVGRRRLGSTRPRTYVTDGSGTNQTSGTLSLSSLQEKHVELEV